MRTETFRCESCRGVYITPQADGSTYHHVCPDLPGNRRNPPRRRPDGRDENVPAAHRPVGTIIAEGKGTKCLSNAKLAEPVWITDRKKLLKPEGEEDDELLPDDL